MSWVFERSHIRVKINGTVVPTLEDVSLDEHLGDLSRTAEFTIAALVEPRPVESDVIYIDLIDGDAALYWTLFAGTINNVDIESDGAGNDFSFIITAVDQLELLRATKKGGDMALDGLTGGEIWKAVAEYCGVLYDNDDIADTGFVFGQHAPLTWKDDSSTAGAAIIQEIDEVEGMKTMTVGPNRVIRFPVDWTPDGSSTLYRSYLKSSSADFGKHHRSTGDRDAIQNVWRVEGAAVDSADGSCTSTPWAYASHGNAQIGRRTRQPEQSFSSDFVQDTTLAEAIATRLMERYNREPDTAGLAMVIDPNLHPGCVVRLVDDTYGIDADGRRCLVTDVQRAGFSMSADLICGAAGATGTVTSGVDTVCGDDHSDTDWDDDYPDTPATYPPVEPGADIDVTGIWDEPFTGGFAFGGAPAATCDEPADPSTCNVEAWATSIDVEAGDDWMIAGTVTLTADTQAYAVGIDTADGIYRIRIAGGAYYDPLVGAFFYEVLTPFGNRRPAGYAPLGIDHDVKFIYHAAAHTLEFFADLESGICYHEIVDLEGETMGGATTIESITGSPTRASETISHQCGEYVPPDPPDDLIAGPWTVDTGTWLHPGTYIEQETTSGSKIHLTDPLELIGVSDGPHSFTITGSMTLGDETSKVEFRLSAPTSGDGDIFAIYEFAGNAWRTEYSGSVGDRHTHIDFGGLTGTKNGAGYNAISFGDVLDFVLTWDRATSTATMTVSDQHGHTDTQTTTDAAANDNYCDGLDIYLSVFAAVKFPGTVPPAQFHLSSLIVTDDEA
jgi:hypothetical protein